MKPGDERPTQKPEDAGRPGAEGVRQAAPTRAVAKPAELVVFKPPAKPGAASPPPLVPPPTAKPGTPLGPPGAQVRLLTGTGKVRYFTFPKRPLAGAPTPDAGAVKPEAAPAKVVAAPPAEVPPPAARTAPGAQAAAVEPVTAKVERQPKRVKLTDRDRQLMGLLATVRFLTRQQLQRLMFAERDGINLHKRLLALAGEGKYGVEQPYLKKLGYRNWLGEPQTAWMLTALGFNVAETVLATPPRRPTAEVGANFIEHGLLTNELYVQLLEAPLKQALAAARAKAERDNRPSRSFTRMKAGIYARAAHPGLRWHSHDEVRLPWRGYDKGHRGGFPGTERDRVIIPDATLELPGAVAGKDANGRHGRRIFLEAETGSQTVVPEGDTKPGATLNKLERYTGYLTGFAGDVFEGDRRTWYTKAYPDGFAPTVLFMVKDAGREALVTRAIREWQHSGDRSRIHAKALTVNGAAAWILGMLGPGWASQRAMTGTAPAPRSSGFTSGEFRLLRDFSRESFLVIQNMRAKARTNGTVVPEYPDRFNEVLALVNREDAKT